MRKSVLYLVIAATLSACAQTKPISEATPVLDPSAPADKAPTEPSAPIRLEDPKKKKVRLPALPQIQHSEIRVPETERVPRELTPPAPVLAAPDLVPIGTVTPDGWELFARQDGVALYKKDVAGTSIPAYRALGDLEAPIAKLVSLIFETRYHLKWMAKVKVAETVQQISRFEKIEYLVLGAPWPVRDRDAVVRLKLSLLPEKKQVVMKIESVDDSFFPEQSGRVRAWMFPSEVVLTQLGPNLTRVEAQAHADPRGSIPRWIILLYQKHVPRVALRRIRLNAKRPDIQPFPLW